MWVSEVGVHSDFYVIMRFNDRAIWRAVSLVTSQSAISLRSVRLTFYRPVGFCVIIYYPGKYNVSTFV